MVAYQFRMPAGIAGSISRPDHALVESQVGNIAKPFPKYGVFGKFVSGKIEPLEAGDRSSVVAGVLVRSFPAHSGNEGLGVATPPTSGVLDFLRRGYISVKCSTGSPAKNGQVYARVATAEGKAIGDIETALVTSAASAAKSGGNTGNGTFALDGTTPVLANAKPGVYTLRCVTAVTNGGVFRIEDPDGIVIGESTIAAGAGGTVLVNEHIKGVITDGGTDFVAGDGFDITVTFGTIPVPNCTFVGPADASGNTEIAFNL